LSKNPSGSKASKPSGAGFVNFLASEGLDPRAQVEPEAELRDWTPAVEPSSESRNRIVNARLFLVGLALSCASAPPLPRDLPPHAVKSLPTSSIAAVLLHRGELDLSDRQAEQLGELEAALDRQNRELRASPGAARGNDASHGRTEDADRPDPGPPGAGSHGRRRAPGRSSHAQPDVAQAIARAMDDNDKQAYLRAEEVLTPSQRERARDIAEQYREHKYDDRENDDSRQGSATSPR
jgi:hypothetical protein